MLKTERQDAVVRLTDEQGTLTVRDASESLQVSEMTIRRDLEELAAQGRVIRVHGGARSVRGERGLVVPREFTHSEKRALHREEKAAIGRLAAGLIEEGNTVFLGAGTTMEQVAQQLPEVPMRVVTNSLSVFDIVRRRDDIELCLIGGTYRPSTDAFVGPMAEQAVQTLGLDKAFIGVNGILDHAVSTSNMEEGRFQSLVLEASDQRVIVTDSSKLGRRDFYTFYDLDSVDALVTDRLVTPELRAALESHTRVLS